MALHDCRLHISATDRQLVLDTRQATYEGDAPTQRGFKAVTATSKRDETSDVRVDAHLDA